MVRIASRKQIGTKNGTIVSTVSGVSLGGSTVSAGNTSTAANVQGIHAVTPSGSIVTPGASVNQLSNPSGTNLVSSAIKTSTSSDTQGTNSEYKLSLASMLLAMKNQALGALSLGGSKTGGSVTENISGINLG